MGLVLLVEQLHDGKVEIHFTTFKSYMKAITESAYER